MAREQNLHDPIYLETEGSITSLVRLLIAERGEKKKDIAELLGLNPQSLSHSLMDPSVPRHRQWLSHEIVTIAHHFQISTDALMYDSDARQQVIEELKAAAAARIEDI